MKRGAWFFGGAVGVGLLLTTVLVLRCQKQKVLAKPGRAQSSVLAGEVLVAVDEVTFERRDYQSRLVAIDARTGTQLAMRVVEERGVVCGADAAKQVWCRMGGVARGVDARTLADHVHGGAAPELPSLVVPVSCAAMDLAGDRVVTVGDALVRTTDSGTRWSVPATGSCQAIGTVGDLVVVAVSGNPRALGIDAASGAVRWSFGF